MPQTSLCRIEFCYYFCKTKGLLVHSPKIWVRRMLAALADDVSCLSSHQDFNNSRVHTQSEAPIRWSSADPDSANCNWPVRLRAEVGPLTWEVTDGQGLWAHYNGPDATPAGARTHRWGLPSRITKGHQDSPHPSYSWPKTSPHPA